jgi:m7GpppX diphosphatase
VSDQHATLLCTTHYTPRDNNKKGGSSDDDDGADGDDEKATAKTTSSILKMTLVPYHKSLLGSNPVVISSNGSNKERRLERNALTNDPIASANIISFLRNYEYELKSESGAEYHYYIARPTTVVVGGKTLDINEETNIDINNDDDGSSSNGNNNVGAFDIELISPATPHQIMRALPSLGHVLIHETPELYGKVVAPYIRTIIDNGSLAWMANVISGQKEKERLLVDNSDFIINIDTKWRTHPSPLTTPGRDEWYNHACTSDLYCLGITKDSSSLSCLRDLRRMHIPLLQSMQRAGLDSIREIYGIPSNQIRIFVHYQPQFYHFYVHFTRLENEIGSTVERGHMVCDIIQNLQLDDEYYKKRTITYKLARGMPLLSLIEEYQQ